MIRCVTFALCLSVAFYNVQDQPNDDPLSPVGKMKQFYRTCMNGSTRLAERGQLLKERMLWELGFTQRNQSQLPRPATVGAAMRVLHERFGKSPHIPSTFHYQTRNYCVRSIDLHERYYNINSSVYEILVAIMPVSFLDAYKAIVQRTSGLCVDMGEVKDYDLQELMAASPTFGWPQFLGESPDSNITVRAPVCMTELSRALAGLYEEQSEDLIKFFTRLIGIDDCFQTTIRIFGEAATAAMSITPEDKRNVRAARHLADGIVTELHRYINSSFMLDESTRDIFREKLSEMSVNIGYPELVEDDEGLRELYEPLNLTGELVEDWTRVASWRSRARSGRCDLDVWNTLLAPTTVNAGNLNTKPHVNMPLAFLRAFGYNDLLPSALSYGSIGMILAHEIMHSFGPDFISYNGWRKPIELNLYSKRWIEHANQCIVKYYNQLADEYVFNASSTLGENVADVYGLRLAYEAWRALSREEREVTLPGLAYTPDQLFFISYAQGWCQKNQGLDIDDVHAPHNARVMGALGQTEQFAEAFQCRPGSRFNRPEQRCTLW